MTVLKTTAVIFAILTLAFLWLAHSGDNPDAKALAGLFYFPAIACGILDAILWAFVIFKK